MSGDAEQGASVSEGQASPPAGESKPRFRATILLEWEPDITVEAYGTLDPVKAAKVDEETISNDPASFLMAFDDSTVKVEVEEAKP